MTDNTSETKLSEAKNRLKGFMGLNKFFKRTDSKPQSRRRSFSFLSRRSRSREETRTESCLRSIRAGEGQSPEVRRSREIGCALRKIGDELNNSTLSLPTTT